MYTDDINAYLEEKYGELSLSEINEYKLKDASLYEDDEINQKLSDIIKTSDFDALTSLIKEIEDIEILLEVISRLNTININEEQKEALYQKYLALLNTADVDLMLDIFEEVLSYSFSSPLNGKDFFLLDLYDKMMLNSFKDQDYTKFKAKAIKELRKANISQEVNQYLDKIIKRL